MRKTIRLKINATASELRAAVAARIEGEELLKRWNEKSFELETLSIAPFTAIHALAKEFGFEIVPCR